MVSNFWDRSIYCLNWMSRMSESHIIWYKLLDSVRSHQSSHAKLALASILKFYKIKVTNTIFTYLKNIEQLLLMENHILKVESDFLVTLVKARSPHHRVAHDGCPSTWHHSVKLSAALGMHLRLHDGVLKQLRIIALGTNLNFFLLIELVWRHRESLNWHVSISCNLLRGSSLEKHCNCSSCLQESPCRCKIHRSRLNLTPFPRH